MTARSRAAATASLMGAVWGCGANGERAAAVIAVSPPTAYNNTASSLLIEGGPFRPAYRFDTRSGNSSIDLTAFSARLTPASGASGATSPPIALQPVSWLSIGLLTANLPAGIPAGSYDVDVTDPRGQTTGLHAAFLSLGPDNDPPIVTIVAPSPGSIIGANTTVTVTLTADDGAGLVASLSGTATAGTAMRMSSCTIPPATARTICHFQFTAPEPSGDDDVVSVHADAMDDAGHPGSADTSFRLVPAPMLTGLAPTVGPATGGTAIDIHGIGFVAPTDTSDGSQLLIDGVPAAADANMVQVVSPTEMTAVLSGHDPGYATVAVANGEATTSQMYFEFFAAPVVKMVSPDHGPSAGGTYVAIVGSHFRDGDGTTIWIGGSELISPCFVSSTRVEGFVPYANDPGPVTVTAYDPIGGTDTRPNAYTYESGAANDAPDGGVAPPSCGGSP